MNSPYVRFAFALAATLVASTAHSQPTPEESTFLDQLHEDGKVDQVEWARMHKIYERLNIAEAKKLAVEKFSAKRIEPVNDRRLKLMDPQKHPWVPATQKMMNTDVDPLSHKPNWHLEAVVDYDSDGKPDTARIHTNGSQWAVIVKLAAVRKRPVIAIKTDGAPFEIFPAGERILMSIPDLGSRLLLMHNGKPALVFLGGD